MQVALDIRAVQSRRYGERGVARYTRGLVGGLLAIDAPIGALVLDPNQPWPELVPEAWTRSGLLTAGTAANIRALPRPFAVHSTSPFEMERPVGTATSGTAVDLADRVVATVYDLIPATMPEIYLQDHAVRRAYESRLRGLRDADLLLAISDDCRKDVIELLGVDAERVVTVYAATNQPPSPDDPGDDRDVLRAELPAIVRRPVLSISGYEPRKNTLALIDAYAALDPDLRRDLQLVIVCAIAPHGRDAWLERATASGLDSDEVVVTGSVSDRVLAALHRAAVLEVFPSLAEGFGLPVLEAAHARTPVITSSTTATPEILDLPSSTFDPRDVDDMAARMGQALRDDDFRAELMSAGDAAVQRYTWDDVARRTADAYGRLTPLARRRSSPPTRLALVGPYPPAVSGVANYNERVASALATRADVTVLSEHSPWAPATRDHRLHPITTLGEQIDPSSFDRMVHTLGNSLVHRRTLLAALAHPDMVWLHEIDLRELHLLTARLLADDNGPDEAIEWLGTRLDANGGDGGMAAQLLDGSAGSEVMPTMIAELSNAARLVVLNTEHGRRVVASACETPTAVIPLAVPSPGHLHLVDGGPTDPPTIASFGILSATKRPDVVVDAFVELSRQRPATLAFVGPCDDAVRAGLEDRASAAGVLSDVVFTGHVDPHEYGRWLSTASVAVQLRREQNGAQSGAVADAFGASIPVVTDMEVERPAAAAFVEPGCSARVLADAIANALDNPPPPHEHLTYDDIAARLIEAIEGS